MGRVRFKMGEAYLTEQMVPRWFAFIPIALIEEGAQKARQQGRSRQKTGSVASRLR